MRVLLRAAALAGVVSGWAAKTSPAFEAAGVQVSAPVRFRYEIRNGNTLDLSAAG